MPIVEILAVLTPLILGIVGGAVKVMLWKLDHIDKRNTAQHAAAEESRSVQLKSIGDLKNHVDSKFHDAAQHRVRIEGKVDAQGQLLAEHLAQHVGSRSTWEY